MISKAVLILRKNDQFEISNQLDRLVLSEPIAILLRLSIKITSLWIFIELT